MAVYAAHLTRTLQGTPSIFQVTAQEALASTVKPALRKLIEYLGEVYPGQCGWSVHWYDELYLLFDCCLQYHYLKHYAASFSESFYGLVRVPTGAAEFSSGSRLPPALERGSLALLVLAPYLWGKLAAAAQRWRRDDEDGLLGKERGSRLRRAAVRLHSAAHLTASGARLVQLARYLAGAAGAHCPALGALGVTLRDAPASDEGDSWGDLFRAVVTGQYGSLALSFPLVGRALLRGVEYGAFGVQFLRWWDARRGAPQGALPAPPPPEVSGERWRNKCPLCLQAWRAPTVLPISGYVFCYACVSRHVRAARTCPVTALPAAEATLVRLYVD